MDITAKVSLLTSAATLWASYNSPAQSGPWFWTLFEADPVKTGRAGGWIWLCVGKICAGAIGLQDALPGAGTEVFGGLDDVALAQDAEP